MELVNAESRRPRQQNPDAVDLTMRGWALMLQSMTRERDQSGAEYVRASRQAQHPGNAEGVCRIAYCYMRDPRQRAGSISSGPDYAALAIRAADQAQATDSWNAMAAYAKGLFLATTPDGSLEAKTVIEAALQRNPKFRVSAL